MQGSNTDTFIKTKKQQKKFDDGTGKRQNAKQGRGSYSPPVRDKRQEH